MHMNARSLRHAGMTVMVWPDPESASHATSEQICKVISDSVARRGRAVLGLATGSTPERVYAQLVQRHQAGKLSFSNVTTFNLDEYYPISPLNPLSYRAYMNRHLFSHIDIAPNRAHVLDGTVPEDFTGEHAAEFDHWVEAEGGLDVQLLGIGRNGHIGFNEPCNLDIAEVLCLPTRLVDLHPITRADAVREFGTEDQVIPRALTMGIAPILAARSIIMLATGPHKAEAVAAALTGPMTPALPASLLQSVPEKVTWIIDEPAAQGLANH